MQLARNCGTGKPQRSLRFGRGPSLLLTRLCLKAPELVLELQRNGRHGATLGLSAALLAVSRHSSCRIRSPKHRLPGLFDLDPWTRLGEGIPSAKALLVLAALVWIALTKQDGSQRAPRLQVTSSSTPAAGSSAWRQRATTVRPNQRHLWYISSLYQV